MTDPLSTRAARLLEIRQRVDNAYPEQLTTNIKLKDLAWLLAELTAAEAERDELKQLLETEQLSNDVYHQQLTAAREALRQLVAEWRAQASLEKNEGSEWAYYRQTRCANELEAALIPSAVPQEKP